jgi:ribonuclease Z
MRLVEAGINPPDVHQVFFTHHHFDHNSDFAYFALASWVMGRKRPLQVFGPEGTEEFCRVLFGKLYAKDIQSRRAHAMYSEKGCEVEAHDITQEGAVLSTPEFNISAAITDHMRPHIKSLAYRIDSGGCPASPTGRSVVIVGDTTVCDSLKRLARGAGLLVHECTFPTARIKKGSWEKWHTPPAELGRWAKEAGVKRILLKHFAIQEGVEAEPMAEEVKKEFKGEVIIGEDLMTLKI